jgi:predicted transposase YdaD
MEIVTSWMETGMERGMERGLAQGRQEGRAEGERALFLRLAERRLGIPDEAVLSQVQSASPEQIEHWADQLLQVESWEELLSE